MKIISFLFSIILMVSCKTIQVNQLPQQTTRTVVEIVTIGNIKNGIENNTLQPTTVTIFNQKIRLAASIVTFNDKTFNAYAQAALQQNEKIKVTYIDSVANKPGYANLQILDKVQLLNELNAAHNSDVNAYLQNTHNTKIITSISSYFDAIELSSISQAEEVYLINNKPQKYSLELVKEGKSFAIVDISKGVPFAYSTATFCWKKEGGKIGIANLVGQNEGCSRDTYKKVSQLNKKINYFKY